MMVWAGGSHAETRTGSLSSPMVDIAMFRDGEVKRLSAAFGDWLVVCDEISKLRQRYCSLKTTVRAPAARIVGAVDVSTGDDGQPAALIHLPLGVLIPAGITVTFGHEAKVKEDAPTRKADDRKARPIAKPHYLAVTTCEPSECLAFWNINGAEIAELRRGKSLNLHFLIAKILSVEPTALTPREFFTSVDLPISPNGFASALTTSMR